ncbi:PAS domain S-box protein [Ideonella sp. A 288]|uniref:sensor histidine kinase n=1 Tax=Ideonella sp. A 288 TaxID=1962181 RepID=UPI000B4B2DCE|nr:PAS domain S-box protein [Ideonella sp. A 288]
MALDSDRDIAHFARRLADHAPSMLAYWDTQMRCRFANRAYELRFGVDPDELVGRSIVDLLGPHLYALNEPYIRAALRGESQQFERVVPGPDGVQRHSLATYTPDVVDGQVVGFVVQITDVTPLKAVQDQLQVTIASLEAEIRRRRTVEESLIDTQQREVAESRFRLVFEASSSALLMLDRAHRIVLLNQRAEQLFGYHRDELLGQSIERLVPESARAAHAAQVAEFVARSHTRAMGIGRDLRARRKDGSEVAVEIGLDAIEMPDGRYTLASVIDITERKRDHDELRRSNAELEQFAYIASHDLQEPLRMVASYTELLAQRYKGRLDDKADKYIYYAVDGAKRMQRLVADLLAFSRVGSQGKPLIPVAVDAVVRRAVAALQASMLESGARVDAQGLPTVLGDETQLVQLFQNLIGNAIKFRAEPAPHIIILATRQRERWVFEVKDNAIGIEMQYAERIFLMFQRLHERGTHEGSGIGLAIVKRIVERHEGQIWVESVPGRGTSFFFTLASAEAGTAPP